MKVISADCAWNTNFAAANDAKDAGYPVTGVKQRNALAFCTWAAKRLCGSTHGGPRLLHYCGLHHLQSVVPRVLEEWLDEASSGHPFFRALKGPGFRCCKDE